MVLQVAALTSLHWVMGKSASVASVDVEAPVAVQASIWVWPDISHSPPRTRSGVKSARSGEGGEMGVSRRGCGLCHHGRVQIPESGKRPSSTLSFPLQALGWSRVASKSFFFFLLSSVGAMGGQAR